MPSLIIAERSMTVAGIIILLSAPLVLADTDYHCLNECARAGKTSTICMPECTYEPQESFHKKEVNPGTTPLGANHNAVIAPTPVREDTLLLHKGIKAKKETIDYACAQKCEEVGGQYELCRHKCIQKDERNLLSPLTPHTPAIYHPQ